MERANLRMKINIIRDHYPDADIPNLDSLSIPDLETLYNSYIIKIKDKNDLKSVYRTLVDILQCLYHNVIKDDSKYQSEYKELNLIGRLDFGTVYKELETGLNECK